jgi:hypothetical protein
MQSRLFDLNRCVERFVRKARLKLAQRSRPSHPMSLPPDTDRRRTAPSYYILTYLGQRDEPRLSDDRIQY